MTEAMMPVTVEQAAKAIQDVWQNYALPVGPTMFVEMAKAALNTRATPPSPAGLDNCQLCYGANGGVPGNENRIGGLVVCDYCTIKLSDAGLTANGSQPDRMQTPGCEPIRGECKDCGSRAVVVFQPEDQSHD